LLNVEWFARQEPKQRGKFVMVDSGNDVKTEGIVQRIIAHRFVSTTDVAIRCCPLLVVIVCY